MDQKVDILAFGAHPDDVELSVSGTLMKHIDQGKRVGIVDLTEGQLGSRGSVEERYDEAANASAIMGVHHRENLRMEDGFFEDNQQNKMKIIEQIRRFTPEVVLCCAKSDRHPDHGRASKLIREACFLSGLHKIESNWNGNTQESFRPRAVYSYIQDYYLEPDFVVDVTDYVDKKIEVIKAFKSQFYNPNSSEPNTPISGKELFDFIKGRMMQFGRPAGYIYAEGFQAERYIGVQDLLDLN